MIRSLFFLVSLVILMSQMPIAVADESPWFFRSPVPRSQTHPCQITAMADLPSSMLKKWIHSHEEDQGEIRVYRPEGYPLPLSRGREGVEFRQDGTLIQQQIGATDRRETVPGHWTVQDSGLIQVTLPNQSAYQLTVLECSDQVLKVKQSN
jgi:hypothetical protein